MSAAEETSTETVRKIAELARLELSDDEAKDLAAKFASILGQFRVLETLDVSGVEAMTGANRAGEVLREDVPVPSLPAEEMLRNAPEHTSEFYVVPKTVGGEA
jgi:aspartyl-tRNA(Asn)/glutamyl-tRNA(Gln) amidotransferase subunit C